MIERLLRTLREIPLLPSCLYTLQIDFPLREDSVEFKGKKDFKGKSDKEPQFALSVGMAMRQGGTEGWDLRPCPVWFCFALSLPRMTEKTFSPHPSFSGPRSTP